jgi:Flp pilus assembly protein TadB
MSPDSGLWITLVVVFMSLLVAVPVLLISGFFLVRLFKNSARNRAILSTGEAAQAVIVSVVDTGVTVNDCPQARLTLQVHPATRPPFMAETTLLVGRFQTGMVIPGMNVQVRFDPADPSRVAVESFSAPPQMWQRP